MSVNITRSWVKTAALVLALFILGGALLFTFVIRGLCSSTVQTAEYSPGAKYIARLEQSDCGAVTPFDTDVVVLETEPRLGMRIFGHSKNNVYTFVGASSHVKLHWEDSSTLMIQCEGCKATAVHIWKTRWKGISIKYMILPSDEHLAR